MRLGEWDCRYSARNALAVLICCGVLHGAEAPAVKQAVSGPAASNEAVYKALEKVVSIDFTATPIVDVVDYFHHELGVNVVLDKKGFELAQVELKTPVTIYLKDVTIRTALELILWPLQLAAVPRDGVLLFTDSTETAQFLTTRVYSIPDLLAYKTEKDTFFSDPLVLMKIIEDAVRTDTWKNNGGIGSIGYLEQSFCLVITQTEAAHRDVEKLFADMRRGAQEYRTLAANASLPNIEAIRVLQAAGAERRQLAREKSRDEEKLREVAENGAALKLLAEQEQRAKLRLLEAQAKLAELEYQLRHPQLKPTPEASKPDSVNQ